MTTTLDDVSATLLAHKGSPVPLEPPCIESMSWPQRIRTASEIEAERLDRKMRARSQPPHFPTLATDPLRPLYTEKLAKSPRFPSLAEAAQRRRDRWAAIIARGGIAMMVAALALAFWKNTGVIPAGAFVAGLIIFAAACFINGCRNRNRLL